jgi:signal transduction histidine kinase
MKSIFNRSLPIHISIAFAIGIAIPIINIIALFDNLSGARSDRFYDGHQVWIGSMAGSVIVILVLVLFYGLIKCNVGRSPSAEPELQRSDDLVKAGTLVRTEQLSALAHHLLHVTEEEKVSLARELHSEFGACLSVITMDISVVAVKLEETEPALHTRLKRAMEMMDEMISLKRRIVGNLHPNMLDSLGLSFSLPEYSTEFSRLTGLPVSNDICEDFDRIDPNISIALFRIAQESMENVAKHASAGNIWIALQPKDAGLSLRITDDGKGIALDALDKPESHGLAGMRERAIMLGGALTVRHRENGSGTEIEVYVPLSPTSQP